MTVEANGCESTDQVLIQLENKPTITSSPLTGAESCGIITYEISTDAADSRAAGIILVSEILRPQMKPLQLSPQIHLMRILP